MNVEIWTEAAQFPVKEYKSGIFLAVYLSKPPLQASITKKGWSLAPSSCFGEGDASQVKPLVYSLCGA
jgi:hypothetical protein